MEIVDKYKEHVNQAGEIIWYFQVFRTTRRGFKRKREAQLDYIEMEENRQ
ncbi:hypothetical protein HB803_13845 [Listeria welshimeri]|nr:hypothetical protein [Listeria welshimeri]